MPGGDLIVRLVGGPLDGIQLHLVYTGDTVPGWVAVRDPTRNQHHILEADPEAMGVYHYRRSMPAPARPGDERRPLHSFRPFPWMPLPDDFKKNTPPPSEGTP